MPERLPVSVCMLVFNEEDRLPRTLSPLSAFAEFVVIDTGSTDRSPELCRNAGATIHNQKWEGFGPTRIRLFQKATQPWILWLDADEVITPGLLDEMRVLFEKNPDDDGYEINRMVFFQNRWIHHGDWFPDWNLRLFRASAWTLEPRAVHESLQIKGRVARLNGLIEHHTYRDWEDLRKRSEKYAKLWAEEHAGKKHPGPASALAHACFRFFKGLVLKKGFLDGALGWKIAAANAREVSLKYQYLRQRQRGKQAKGK